MHGAGPQDRRLLAALPFEIFASLLRRRLARAPLSPLRARFMAAAPAEIREGAARLLIANGQVFYNNVQVGCSLLCVSEEEG